MRVIQKTEVMEAIQYDGTNLGEIVALSQAEADGHLVSFARQQKPRGHAELDLKRGANGIVSSVTLLRGDWAVMSTEGIEFYSDKAFRAMFMEAGYDRARHGMGVVCCRDSQACAEWAIRWNQQGVPPRHDSLLSASHMGRRRKET